MPAPHARIHIDVDRTFGERSSLLFSHFLEHFHRQIYGGVYDPASPLADEHGFRIDVIEALRRIRVPLIRWPGGCFASAYHWQHGIGATRRPTWDKAWQVSESNLFGTDEFLTLCRTIGAEPYICTNAGSGTLEEMSDWVEYCNLPSGGRWAEQRIINGYTSPHQVRFWSIGNENWGDHEIGAKTPEEWSCVVTEAAKMMKRVDSSIRIAAAGTGDLDWDKMLLRAAHRYLDFVAIHDYGTMGRVSEMLMQAGHDYLAIVAGGQKPELRIRKMEHILGSLDLLGQIGIAFDEWNPRGWHHPSWLDFDVNISERDLNDDNATYTMADAVAQACFLNACLRHCQTVGMANFSPIVNTRGAIFTYDQGIVLRSTYHVFDLYVNHTFADVLDAFYDSPGFATEIDGRTVVLPHLDACVTFDRSNRRVAVALTNLHPDEEISCTIRLPGVLLQSEGVVRTVNGASTRSYNDIDRPNAIQIREQSQPVVNGMCIADLAPHSVNVITLQFG